MLTSVLACKHHVVYCSSIVYAYVPSTMMLPSAPTSTPQSCNLFFASLVKYCCSLLCCTASVGAFSAASTLALVDSRVSANVNCAGRMLL
jgi:hypothetical protein